MINQWILTQWPDAIMVVASCWLTYLAIIVCTRVAGLRSFSKMSAPDFAMTVAVGSLFATTMATPGPPLILGIIGIGALFVGQWVVAWARERFHWFEASTDNSPIMLMIGSDILFDNLRHAKVTESDLYAKLREANVMNFDQVCAVVFETTGDISVLHSKNKECLLEKKIFAGVDGSDGIPAEKFCE